MAHFIRTILIYVALSMSYLSAEAVGVSDGLGSDSVHEVLCEHSNLLLLSFFSVLFLSSFVVYILFSRRRSVQTSAILKLLPVRIIVADKDGRISYFGQGSLEDFEFKSPLKNLSDFYNKPIAGLIKNNIIEVIKTGNRKTVHFELNGKKRSADVIKIPYKLFGKNVAGWISQDTQELQEYAQTENIQAQKFSKILQSIGDGVIVTDSDSKINLMNSQAEFLTGYSKDEAYGKDVREIFKINIQNTDTPIDSPIELAIKTKKVANLASRADLVRKDGSRIHISDSVAPIFSDEGIVGAVLVFKDVTSDDKRSNDLYDANSVVEAFMQNAPAYIVAKDVNDGLRYTACNKAFSELVGLPRNEIIGHQDKEFFSIKTEYDSFLECDIQAAETGSIVNRILPFTGKDGVAHVGNFHWIPLKLSGGRFWIYIIVDDITELYRSKIESENLAERLRLTLNSIGDAVIVTDVHGNVTMLNPIAEAMMGCTQSEAKGRVHTDFFKIVNALDNWETPSPLMRSLRTGEIVELANHTDLISKDGTRYNIADSSAPIRDSEGKIVGGILVFRDVSEEYAQRRNLMNLTILLSSIMDNLPAEMFLKDGETLKYVRVNPSIENLLGVKKNEILGRTDFELLPKLLAESVSKSDLEALKSDELHETTLCHNLPDGLEHYSRFYRRKIRNSEGKSQILGIVVDITNQEKQRLVLEEQKKILDKYNIELQQNIIQNELQKKCITGMLSVNDFSDSFDKLSEMLANYLNPSCVTIEEYIDCEVPYLKSLKIWRNKGQSSTFDLTKIMESDFPAIIAHLKSGGVVRMRKEEVSGETLSGWQKETYDYLNTAGAEEVICIPIMRKNKFWGYLGAEINSGKFVFGDVGERMLTTTANLIEILLAREEMRTIQQRSDEEKFMILNMLPLPVVMLNSEYKILHANKAAEEMSGIELENIKNSSCRETICRNKQLNAECPVWQTLRTFQPQTREKVFNGKTYRVNTLPVIHDGKIEKIINVYIDLTDVNKNKKLLQQVAEKAERAAKEKSQFLATMSHEIRTPLNAVVGFSELLQNTEISKDEQQDYLHSINLAGNALLELINDILDLSKMESNAMTINAKRLDVYEMVKEMSSIFKHKIEEKNLKFAVVCGANIPNLSMDTRKIRQIILNLLGNAIKFTNSGGIDFSIKYLRKNNDAKIGDLEIEVKDTGIGISKEKLPIIFDPFVQEENPLQRVQGGTGLGLPIAKRLVEAMGGELVLVSEIGKGSTFTVKIPNVSVEYESEFAQEESVENKKGNVSSSRILIVDDVDMNLKVLGSMLKRGGYDFKATNSAVSALQLLDSEHFDCVLTDLWMPEMDGTSLAESIKSNPNLKNVKVIVVTADVINNNSAKMKIFDGILLKPISLATLQNVLS